MPYTKIDAALSNTDVTITTPQAADFVSRLTGGMLTAANTVTIQFLSGSGNTALTGAMTMIAGVPFVLPSSPGSPGSGRRYGYLQGAGGEALKLRLGGNVQVSGSLEWVEDVA